MGNCCRAKKKDDPEMGKPSSMPPPGSSEGPRATEPPEWPLPEEDQARVTEPWAPAVADQSRQTRAAMPAEDSPPPVSWDEPANDEPWNETANGEPANGQPWNEPVIDEPWNEPANDEQPPNDEPYSSALGREDFRAKIAQYGSNKLIIIHFFDQGAEPTPIEEYFHTLSEMHPDVHFLDANMKSNEKAITELNIEVAPTFVAFINRREVGRYQGLDADDLNMLLNSMAAPNSPTPLSAVDEPYVSVMGREDFRAKIAQYGSNKLLVIHFFNQDMEPAPIEEYFHTTLSEMHPNAYFLDANMKSNEHAVAELNIMGSPTFVAFRDRREVGRYQGLDTDDLNMLVETYKQ